MRDHPTCKLDEENQCRRPESPFSSTPFANFSPKTLAGTLKRIAELGFTQVEPFAFLSFGDDLRVASARPASPRRPTHQSFIGRDHEPVFEAAKALGIETVIDPYRRARALADGRERRKRPPRSSTRPPRSPPATASASATTTTLRSSRAPSTASPRWSTSRASSLPRSSSRSTPTGSPSAVDDPVELLRKLGDRVVALHVKDGPGTTETKDQVAVGQGSLAVEAIIAAAPGRTPGHRARRLARRPVPGRRRQLRLPHLQGPRHERGTGRVGVGVIGAGVISKEYLTQPHDLPRRRGAVRGRHRPRRGPGRRPRRSASPAPAPSTSCSPIPTSRSSST